MVQPRRFTREGYHRLLEAGVIQEDGRVELIEGTVVEMSPIGSQHAAVVKRLNALFHQTLAGQALVGVQDPIRLSPLSEPQPDLVLLRPRPDSYAQDHPGPEDIFLLVEVAEASLSYDRQVKLPLYAQAGIAGIPEVWLVNLGEIRVEVLSESPGRGLPGGEMRELDPGIPYPPWPSPRFP